MINGKRIVVVLPAYNAARTLEATVRELPDIVDERIALDQQADKLVVIILVGAIDLGGDLQRHAAVLSDADGAVDPLLRRDAIDLGAVARLRRANWCFLRAESNSPKGSPK